MRINVVSFGYKHGLPARRRHRARLPVPAEPALGRRAAPAHRARRRRARLRARPARHRARSSSGSTACSELLLPGLRPGGPHLPVDRRRLHRRAPPLGRRRRGASPTCCGATATRRPSPTGTSTGDVERRAAARRRHRRRPRARRHAAGVPAVAGDADRRRVGGRRRRQLAAASAPTSASRRPATSAAASPPSPTRARTPLAARPRAPLRRRRPRRATRPATSSSPPSPSEVRRPRRRPSPTLGAVLGVAAHGAAGDRPWRSTSSPTLAERGRGRGARSRVEAATRDRRRPRRARRRRRRPPRRSAAIAHADLVVLGPGSLYGSVLAAARRARSWRRRRRARRPAASSCATCGPRRPRPLGYDVAAHVAALRAPRRRPRRRRRRTRARCRVGDLDGVEVVAADVARPHGLAHDPARLGDALRAPLGGSSAPRVGSAGRSTCKERPRMTIRVGINGFGRIGRNFFRAAKQRGADIDFVAANDLAVQGADGPPAQATTRSSAPGTSTSQVDRRRHHRRRRRAARSSPSAIPRRCPWGDLGVDMVIESTGIFTAREKAAMHLDAGAPFVIVSAPSDGRRRHLRGRRQRRHVRPGAAQGRLERVAARPTASCRWSRSSTTPSASRRAS